MRIYRLLGVMLFSLIFAGCADIEMPKTGQILKDPLGEGSLERGMTKAQVVSIYGEPDTKRTVSSDGWGRPREEWLYSARYSALPVSTGYLSEDLYLYFDGENLTNICRKPLGKREQESAGEVKKPVK